MKSFRSRLIAPALLLSSCAGLHAAPPNILFIYADDHSPKTVSCYEGSYSMADTPHIDKLAASGVRFRAAYLGSWCMPSRASLLTGLHPHAIESMRMEGKYPGSEYDPEVCKFWPAAFRANGYQTAQIGKWHTGTDAGFGRDWDYQAVWNRPANPDNAGSYFGRQIMDFNGERREINEYSTDYYTKLACDYIRGDGRAADKPWYLWLCYGAIHGPTTPAERHAGKLKGRHESAPATIFGPREGKPAYLENTQAWEPGPDGEPVFGKGKNKRRLSNWVQQVNECMMAVDEGVGAVLAALEESGQAGNTLVIYSSDQGFANGEHGMKQKVAPYDATYSSPFIVAGPGVARGAVSSHCVNSPDTIVTFFSLAGIETPWPMHGRDFSKLLSDPAAEWDHPTLYMHTGQKYGSAVAPALGEKKGDIHAGVPFFGAVCHGGMKYIRYLKGEEPEELYDLARDPEEITNLATDPRYKDGLEAMRGHWNQEMERVGALSLAR
jgi:arylsulfatase A-like enzyme